MKNIRSMAGIVLLGWALSARGGMEILFTPDGPVRRSLTQAAPAPAVDPVEAIVIVPVADIRLEPVPVSADAARVRPYPVDDRQGTQALFGESVWVFEQRDGFFRVTAPDQPEFSPPSGWRDFSGWVRRDHLVSSPGDFGPNALVTARYARVQQSKARGAADLYRLPMGSRVRVIYREKGWARLTDARGSVGWMREKHLRMDADPPPEEAQRRAQAVSAARQFLGEPVYGGGRAGHRRGDFSEPSGVDASGLVNIACRVAGLRVPRLTHDQFMASRPVTGPADLRPGDLVFVADTLRPDRMAHVLLFEGGEHLLEADPRRRVIRRVTFQRKWGQPRHRITPGVPMNGVVLHLGRLFQP